MARSRPVRAAGAALALALAALPAGAQNPAAISQPSRTQEFGLDAAATFGLGSDSYVNVGLPASRARIGFFLTNDSRWSIEPGIGFLYSDSEGSDGTFVYDLELGALYHFQTPSNLVPLTPGGGVRSTVAYARPFLNYSGTTGDGSDGRFTFGAGVGVKVPWRESLASRFEANLGYDIDNEALRLGVTAGLSFFTRNLIR